MLRSFSDNIHRLRVMIDGDKEDKERLYVCLSSMFYEPSEYDQQSTQEPLDNILFLSGDDLSGSLYGPLRLLPIIEGCILKLQIDYTRDIEYLKDDIDESITARDDILEGITLRDYQVTSVERALQYKSGIIKVCTGGGKTEIALSILRTLYDTTDGNMIMCVPSTKLLYQTRDRAIQRGFSQSDITLYGDGNEFDTSCRLLIATVQTLSRRLNDDEFIKWRENLLILIMDEAHHCSARTFYSVVDTLAPEYVLGVTAEPYYGDKTHKVQDLLVRGLLGPILYEVTVPMLVEKGFLSKPYLLVFDPECNKNILTSQVWSSIQKYGLIENPLRNSMIINIADSLVSVDKRPLILISQIKHGILLSSLISSKGHTVALMTGGSSVDIYRDGSVIDSFKDSDGDIPRKFTEGLIDVLVGTSVLDEGVDIPAISAVILAGGGKSPIKVVQRLGRSLRPKKNDNTTILIDFLDTFNVVTKSHSKKRRATITDLKVDQYICPRSKDVKQAIVEYSEYFRSLSQVHS